MTPTDPAPRWATPRTPGRRTFGPAVAQLAAGLGLPLMPWQRRVVDVALEVVDDPTSPRGWSWAFRTIIVTVQRQSGKTSLVGPVHLHRALTVPRPTYLTAQKRSDARDTWLDVVNRLRASPLRSLGKVRESNGDEGVFLPTGGSFRVFAPTEDALHGKANALVTIDEGWAFDEAQGAALEQAVLPTFTTTGGQLWLPSTAGHGGSTWLRGYVDRGRAAVDADRRDGVAYFDWSLPDDEAAAVAAGLDTDDPVARGRALDLVLARHPAAGRTLDRGALEQAADTMTPDGFLRAYGNVWTATADRVIPEHVWTAARASSWPEPGVPVALAVDVALDRQSAAVAAAWRDTETGPMRVDVVESHPGTGWVVGRVRELVARWRPVGVASNGGPALDVVDELRRGGLDVQLLNATEYATACASFLSSTTNRRLSHPGRPALDDAVAIAATRPLGEAWAWSRRAATGSLAPLVAATVAAHAFDHRPAPVPRPVLVASRRR